jgi:cephalosporin hydroxylase
MVDESFIKEYEIACNTFGDIYFHLPLLRTIASECNHVTEFGVRDGISTRALLSVEVVLRSYDLYIDEVLNERFELAKSQGRDVEYIKGNTLNVEIQETDFLFIDSKHTYDQLIAELNIHSHKVRKYIAFHDTFTFGLYGEDDRIGLLPAIIEFMTKNHNWKFVYSTIENNGFIVIEKI